MHYNPPVLLERVRAFITKHNLLEPDGPLTVGVSGGPDSAALLHILARLAPELRLDLTVAHLDHGLRAESAADAAFVEGLARDYGLNCVVERVDVALLARQRGLSLEEAGREARYTFFARLGPTVAVAHNADDQAETVLMHFLRGSGLDGLRGMLPRSVRVGGEGGLDLAIVRPLLAEPRSEIEAYLADHRLSSVRDASNADTTFFRNRLRHELLPVLQTYNPNIRSVLGRTAEVAAGEAELLQSLVSQAWGQVAQVKSGAVTFDLPAWRALSRPLQRLLLRRAIAQAAPEVRNLDFTPLEAALEWAQTAESGHTADLFAGLALHVSGPHLRLLHWQEKSLAVSPPEAVSLTVPGRTVFGDWTIDAEAPALLRAAEVQGNADAQTAYLDAQGGPWLVRAREPGDRFIPLGLNGHTKLSDYMINRKVPVDRREAWPLVCAAADPGRILWVCGVGLSEAARVPDGGQAIRLSLSAAPAQET